MLMVMMLRERLFFPQMMACAGIMVHFFCDDVCELSACDAMIVTLICASIIFLLICLAFY